MCELCDVPLREFLGEPFHSAALAAFVHVASETGQRVPDSETTRRMAYKYYEELKQKG